MNEWVVIHTTYVGIRMQANTAEYSLHWMINDETFAYMRAGISPEKSAMNLQRTWSDWLEVKIWWGSVWDQSFMCSELIFAIDILDS
jgi:hypothetical protein